MNLNLDVLTKQKLIALQLRVKSLEKQGRVIEMRRLANYAGRMWAEAEGESLQ